MFYAKSKFVHLYDLFARRLILKHRFLRNKSLPLFCSSSLAETKLDLPSHNPIFVKSSDIYNWECLSAVHRPGSISSLQKELSKLKAQSLGKTAKVFESVSLDLESNVSGRPLAVRPLLLALKGGLSTGDRGGF